MLRYIILFQAILFIVPLYSQHSDQTIQKEKKYSPKYKREYLEGTVIFKVKTEKKEEVAILKEKSPSLNQLIKEVGATSLKRMFPNSKAPSKSKNRMGQPLVDITSIYTMKFSSEHSVEEVIQKLKNSGLVEYAEPYFVNHILYIPSDPYVQPGNNQEIYFKNMKAYEAFDIEQGDPSIVIGIIDLGVKWDHEDLVDNIAYNTADPINGIDDDGDGYLDNYRGWDVYYNDNDPTQLSHDHGTVVAGCAAASTDNSLGVSGSGFNCSILPIKAASNSGGAIFPGYDGIVYAAEHGAKVINLSWGGPNVPSEYEQSIINYAVFNWDAVVIAAAGNSNSDLKYYPATYDNVLSVASINTMYHATLDSTVEFRANHSTYNYYVDVMAQGAWIASTSTSGYNTAAWGTSVASPIVAGLAGLVRSRYPSLNALQVAELIRVTADSLIDTLAVNVQYKAEKLGKGRINMYRALTDNILPSIRMYRKNYYDDFGQYAFSDDTVKIEGYFRNYLQPTSNAQVTLSSINPNVTVVKNDFNIGTLGTLDSTDNTVSPFIVYVEPTAGVNEIATFRLGIEDPAKGYIDYQYFEILLNPSFVDIDTNQVLLTMTSAGKLGYIDDASAIGNGMEYKGQSLLYEGGLMLGTSMTKVSDCVRGNPAGFVDSDFNTVKHVKYVHAFEGNQATQSVFTDIGTPDSIGLTIKQRSYAYKNSPDDKYVIIEYDITNESGNFLDSLCAGLFCDWDVMNYNQNKANWLAEDSLGYVYYTGAGGIYTGVCLLTPNPPACYSMDHGSVGGNNINPNDGFPTFEKFTTISKGVERPQAGGSGLGYDVSQVVGGTLYDIQPGEKRTIAFAMVVGDDILDIKNNARRAKDLFRSLNTSSLPVITSYHYCRNDTVDVNLSPSNGTLFNFYDSATASIPVFNGSSYLINDLTVSDTIYVRGADSLFESGSVPAYIYLHSELAADFEFAPDTLDLNISTAAFFVDKSEHANELNWSISDGTSSTASTFLHNFSTAGTYTVSLVAKDSYNCIDSLSKEIVVIGNIPTSFPFVQDGIKIFPNPSSGEVSIEFLLEENQNISISIINSLGEEVYNAEGEDINLKTYLFNASEKGKGIYYARIMIGDKSITRKIIVQ